jgi:hypothetical protein
MLHIFNKIYGTNNLYVYSMPFITLANKRTYGSLQFSICNVIPFVKVEIKQKYKDFVLFVLFCVQVAALRRADPLSKESYRLCTGLRNWKRAEVKQKDYRAIER